MIMQRLSLLARGTRLHAKIPVVGARFIPAGAGNTRLRSAVCISNSVYPRWRGEHLQRFAWGDNEFGLSPLARGTLEDKMLAQLWRRFIPAGAGNTDILWKQNDPSAVYPRWRGEHIISAEYFKLSGGLSPLARGTRIRAIAVNRG